MPDLSSTERTQGTYSQIVHRRCSLGLSLTTVKIMNCCVRMSQGTFELCSDVLNHADILPQPASHHPVPSPTRFQSGSKDVSLICQSSFLSCFDEESCHCVDRGVPSPVPTQSLGQVTHKESKNNIHSSAATTLQQGHLFWIYSEGRQRPQVTHVAHGPRAARRRRCVAS